MPNLTRGLPVTMPKIKREYGIGQRVGYTNDGFVFFVADTQTQKGAPMQTHFYWTPLEAQGMIEGLREAIEGAQKARQ